MHEKQQHMQLLKRLHRGELCSVCSAGTPDAGILMQPYASHLRRVAAHHLCCEGGVVVQGHLHPCVHVIIKTSQNRRYSLPMAMGDMRLSATCLDFG